MNILIYIAHPAQFHLYKNAIPELKERGHKVIITIQSKDILPKLLEESGFEYINLLKKGRKASFMGILGGVIRRNFRHLVLCVRYSVDIFISSAPEFAFIARFLGVKSVNFNEDDLILFDKVRKYLSPWLHHIVCPVSCDNGSLNSKSLKYNGYQELAYLHPAYFKPDYNIVRPLFGTKKRNFILRFVNLTAWHDEGKSGITDDLALQIIERLKDKGNIFITSEKPLREDFEKYRISIKASDMHHFLYYADLLIGDSQTMCAEAAVLGTPSIRFNDFVRKLGYLEEIEFKYQLTWGIETSQPDKLLSKLDELLNTNDLKELLSQRRMKMLKETIDVNKLMIWIIDRYPESVNEWEKNPNIINTFKSDFIHTDHQNVN